MPHIASALLVLNVVFYAVLAIMLALRLIFFFRKVLDDLSDYGRGPGFFTVVAATCLLGAQVVVITGQTGAAYVLWMAGTVLWGLVMYAFFTAAVVRQQKPTLEAGINGAWLIAIVATQSVSVLGTLLASTMGPHRDLALFFTLGLYLLGAML
jgi:tellurite resistance protein TehA-like permease